MARMLLPLVLLAVGCKSPPSVTTTLAANTSANVVVSDAAHVRVSNQGPGRVRVAFGPEVLVWIGPGGRIRNEPKGEARIELVTEGRQARVRIEGAQASGINLQVTGDRSD